MYLSLLYFVNKRVFQGWLQRTTYQSSEKLQTRGHRKEGKEGGGWKGNQKIREDKKERSSGLGVRVKTGPLLEVESTIQNERWILI